MTDATDITFMQRAVHLGMSQMGRTWPNPAVGCVIVKNGAVIAEGATGDGGRPHAEETALATLDGEAKDATAYVTLEPCGYRSTASPSCSERLITAGVRRVIYACADPSHLASDIGPERMRLAGVQVEAGLMSEEAARMIAPFAHFLKTGLPLVEEDISGVGFDREFVPEGGRDLRGELTEWALKGYRHLYIKTDSELAVRLRHAGLLSE